MKFPVSCLIEPIHELPSDVALKSHEQSDVLKVYELSHSRTLICLSWRRSSPIVLAIFLVSLLSPAEVNLSWVQ